MIRPKHGPINSQRRAPRNSPTSRPIKPVRQPASQKVQLLGRLCEQARALGGNASTQAINDFVISALRVANLLRSDADMWIDFCKDSHWDGVRMSPKPMKQEKESDWVLRFANPKLPTRRRSSLMHALQVLFEARYSIKIAEVALAQLGITAVGGLRHTGYDKRLLELLRQRLFLHRSNGKMRPGPCSQFLALRLSVLQLDELNQRFAAANGGDRLYLELSFHQRFDGYALRVEKFVDAKNGGVG